MGKSEPAPQRFRRKAKSLNTSEQISNSLISSPSAVDNLLCNNVLDSSITSEPDLSPSEETTELTTANGTCNTEATLTDSDIKGSNPALNRDNGVDTTDPPSQENMDRPKNICLMSHLPAELCGLSHSEITPLCTNQRLSLSACHVQKEDSLVFVVFINNCSDSDIQQTLIQVNSEELEVT